MSPGPVSQDLPEPVSGPVAYPPLTPVEVYPLHGWNYGPAYTCQPEGNSLQYDWRCPDCVTKAETLLERHPDTVVRWKRNADAPPVLTPLAWLVARSRAHGVL